MNKINIKPLSVNKCWQGRRFKTKDYLNYETIMLNLLPNLYIIDPPYRVNIIVGFSNKASDIDNILKPFLDILQKKYNINDKHIEILHIEKQLVTKNNDFISFEIVNI
jgi:Holliday junction resolvase RusA-like endonuclease